MSSKTKSDISLFSSAALAAALLASPAIGNAQAALIDGLGGPAGYGNAGDCLGPNDDGSSRQISLSSVFPDGVRFFSQTHQSMYVNTNGNITFSNPLSTYTPNAFPVADRPMIAPFWGDIDIRRTPNTNGCNTAGAGTCHNPTQNGVWWKTEPASGTSPGRLIVTWDRTEYFTGSCNADRSKLVSVQLILTPVGSSTTQCSSGGDFDVEFRYNRCDWETGDASGGSNGFGGTQAQAGFDAGDNTNFVEIPGSRAAGISQHLCTNSNVEIPGVWRFSVRQGQVICPDAGETCSTGGQGLCGEGILRCVGRETQCVAINQASAERCDAIDNDCNGQVDEGDLCTGGRSCVQGACVYQCSEGLCGPGLVCGQNNQCVEAGCEAVTCGEGQRCSAGQCVGGCEGIVCPQGLSCRAGRCLDACEGVSCDESCSTCVDGACVERCQTAGCNAGETCRPNGTCIDSACANMNCSAGNVCLAGNCVDACTGVRCPTGEMCDFGACVPATEVPPEQEDSGVIIIITDSGTRDAGIGNDSGASDEFGNGGSPRRSSKVGCSYQSTTSDNGAYAWIAMAGLGFAVARRKNNRRK